MIKDIDKRILTFLRNDARTPHAKIAEEVGISRPAVSERIKKLEQSGFVKGYSVVLDPDSFGQHITAFISAKISCLLNNVSIKALKELAKNPDILELHSVAGEDCFLIKVRTADMQKLSAIVNSFKEEPLCMSTKTTIVLERYFEKVGGIMLE